jgi:hypothetical protein
VTYLWADGASINASLSEADLEATAGTTPGTAELEPGPTSGKDDLKAAYSSSPGFWELRLCENMPPGDCHRASNGLEPEEGLPDTKHLRWLKRRRSDD